MKLLKSWDCLSSYYTTIKINWEVTKVKVVILAGGYGTRISEESVLTPKPMIEIGGMPILWHVMKLYSHYGFNEFIICAGYKQHIIKEWFADYFLHTSDITFDFSNGNNEMIVHNNNTERWKVTVVDTGLDTMTGGRVKRIEQYIDEDDFMLTYGDGVSDIDIEELLKFHRGHGKLATITAFKLQQRFGVLELEEDNMVKRFKEKSEQDESMISAGFMILNRVIFSMIEGDNSILEKEVLETLATSQQLVSFIHKGFWQCMDTKREKDILENMWNTKQAPWKVW